MVADKNLETQSSHSLKASEMNSNLVISKSIISLNSEDWSLWGQSQSLVLWVLRTEKEALRGGNRNTSFCTALRRKERKTEVRQEEETSVLLNTGDCNIYNILNICFASFQSLLHSNLQSPKGVVLPRRSVVACTCVCVWLQITLQKLLYALYSFPCQFYNHTGKDNTLTLLIVKQLKLSFKEWRMKKQRLQF